MGTIKRNRRCVVEKNASAACERETKNVSYRGSTLARAANEYAARAQLRETVPAPAIRHYLFYFGAKR